MSLVGLLHSLQHRLVDPEADAGREGRQGQVGADADHAELGQREEKQEHAAEHGPGLLHVPPVEQVNGWKGRTKRGQTGLGPNRQRDAERSRRYRRAQTYPFQSESDC